MLLLVPILPRQPCSITWWTSNQNKHRNNPAIRFPLHSSPPFNFRVLQKAEWFRNHSNYQWQLHNPGWDLAKQSKVAAKIDFFSLPHFCSTALLCGQWSDYQSRLLPSWPSCGVGVFLFGVTSCVLKFVLIVLFVSCPCGYNRPQFSQKC